MYPMPVGGMKYGNSELIDGLHKDGLMNIYDKLAMGVFSDQTAKNMQSVEEQDAYAIGPIKINSSH